MPKQDDETLITVISVNCHNYIVPPYINTQYAAAVLNALTPVWTEYDIHKNCMNYRPIAHSKTDGHTINVVPADRILPPHTDTVMPPTTPPLPAEKEK